MSDTQTNRKVVEAKAKLIESNIIYERLDMTLEKYKPQIDEHQVDAKVNISITPVPTPALQLSEIWEKYTQHRSSKVEKSTLVRDYGKIAKRLESISKEVDNAAAVKKWLLEHFSSETTRRTLVQLNACFKWALKRA